MYTLIGVALLSIVMSSTALADHASVRGLFALLLCVAVPCIAICDVRSRSILSGGLYAVAMALLLRHLAGGVSAYDELHARGDVVGAVLPLLAYIVLPISVFAAPWGELARRWQGGARGTTE